ncbi:MAG: acyl carrier protein [Bacteroidetes bacterium]|nr:acyl carrier protein [Bacteroidota bacterium]
MHQRIRLVFSKVFGIDEQLIPDGSSPDTIQGWDSLKHLNLVTALEEEFDVEFTDTEVVECTSPAMAKEILKLKGVGG